MDALREFALLEEEHGHPEGVHHTGPEPDAPAAAWQRILALRNVLARRSAVVHGALPARTPGPPPSQDLVALLVGFENISSQVRVAFEQLAPRLEAALTAAAPIIARTAQRSVLDQRVLQLEGRVQKLRIELSALRATRPKVAPLSTFAPEPYEILKPIPVVIAASDDGYTASFFDANIHTSGDTDEEAFRNLKSLVLDVFDSLSGEPPDQLGREPARQLAVLRSFIGRLT